MTRLAFVLVLGEVVLSAGCATVRVGTPGAIDPRVPHRVAVLPFVDRSSGDAPAAVPFAALLDALSLASDAGLDRAQAAAILRAGVTGVLRRTELRPMDPIVVDGLLASARVDLAARSAGDRAQAARRLGAVLGADVVVFGEVLAWDRHYYVLESVVRVGLRVELRDGATGALLYEGEASDAAHAGLSKVPVAWSPEGAAQVAIVEPIKGLRSARFARLAADVARLALEGLVPSPEERAGAAPPRIRLVAHSATAPLAPGDEIVVVALGDAGARFAFQLDLDREATPMTETAPGCYRGTFKVFAGDPLRGDTLTVRAVGAKLSASTMTVGRPPLAAPGAGVGAVSYLPPRLP